MHGQQNIKPIYCSFFTESRCFWQLYFNWGVFLWSFSFW